MTGLVLSIEPLLVHPLAPLGEVHGPTPGLDRQNVRLIRCAAFKGVRSRLDPFTVCGSSHGFAVHGVTSIPFSWSKKLSAGMWDRVADVEYAVVESSVVK